ncbi:MAG TPA: pilus assembly protein TadG-related protein [Terracidiphilus sp.]
MRKTIASFVRRVFADQSGQTLPFIALAMTGMLGMSGLAIDVGHAYVVRSQLQNAANAAALAASGYVYYSNSDTVNSTSIADLYSASSGGNNVYSALGTVQTHVGTRCVNMLMPVGSTCSSSSVANAVVVTTSTTMKTFFMGLFGVPKLGVNATATASMQGQAQPWNVAIVVDATSSMSSTDSSCGGLTRFECALGGVQTFLAATNPCPPAGCGSGAALRVSLFSFPNLSTATFSNTSPCATGTTFTNEPYTLPTAPGVTGNNYSSITYSNSTTTGSGKSAKTTTTSWAGTYQITGWDSGYYLPSDTSTSGLNSADNLVKAIGYGYSTSTGAMAHKGCLPNVGGESTYYAGAINAAQAALLEEQTANKGSKNAMILLSDGEASAAYAKFPVSVSTASTPSPNTNLGISVSSAGTTTWSKTAANLTGVAGTWGTYPDFNDECQQAIVAAQNATKSGTRIYSVAYGAESSGCYGDTDSTLVTLPATANVPFTAVKSLTPCITMQNIASSLDYFYSDANQSSSNSNCYESVHTVTNLNDIFLAISSTFTTPRLLPNNATGTTIS